MTSRGRWSVARRVAGPAVLAVGLLGLCSCSGGSERAAPTPPSSDTCAVFNNFQTFNFTAKSGPVAPANYETFYRGLVDGASKVAQVKPELRGTLDIVVNADLATASGKPIPGPDKGQVTFPTADATIASYQQQACGN